MSMFTRTALAVALLSVAPLAMAAEEPADIRVSIDIVNSCTIGATELNFTPTTPIVGNIATDIDGSATLTVNCNAGAEYSIGLNDGVNGTRVMEEVGVGTQTVSYDLYLDSPGGTRWDDIGSAGTLVTDTGSNADQTYTVHGRVAAPQSVGAGEYVDTVTATISF